MICCQLRLLWDFSFVWKMLTNRSTYDMHACSLTSWRTGRNNPEREHQSAHHSCSHWSSVCFPTNNSTVCVCFGPDHVTSPHTQIICNLICDRLEKRRRITSQPMLLTSVLMRLRGRAAKTPFLPKLVFKQKLWGCRRTGRKDRKGIR